MRRTRPLRMRATPCAARPSAPAHHHRTSVSFSFKHFLICLMMKLVKVLSLSPMDWNIMSPRGIPAKA